MKHLLKLMDLSKKEINEILNLADQLKFEKKNGIEHHLLKGKTLGMIFQKSSTRTRVSFEVGMADLGGHALFLSSRDLQIRPKYFKKLFTFISFHAIMRLPNKIQ